MCGHSSLYYQFIIDDFYLRKIGYELNFINANNIVIERAWQELNIPR